MRRRPKRTGTRSIKRNIILFLLALVVLSVLIVLASRLTGRSEPIMPPETPERIAQREAPENAYFLFAEAEKLLPTPPGPLRIKSQKDPSVFVLYRFEKGSVGEMLKIRRPDDDPLMIAYWEQCEPAIAKMQEALGKPYYLFPLKWSEFQDYYASRDTLARYAKPLEIATRILTVRGLFAVRTKNDTAEAFRYLLDALRASRMAANDGSHPNLVNFQKETLTLIPQIAHQAPPEVLRDALDAIEPLTAAPSLAPLFEFRCRLLDHNTHAKVNARNSAERLFGSLATGLVLRRMKKEIVNNYDEFLHAIDLPYPEFLEWRNGLHHPERSGTIWRVWETVWHRALVHVYSQGAQLAIAIELYQRENNAYPETLDALVPGYFDALPQDTLANAPFAYRTADGDYTLYSLGLNGRDDNGQHQNPALIIIAFRSDYYHRNQRDDIAIYSPAPQEKRAPNQNTNTPTKLPEQPKQDDQKE